MPKCRVKNDCFVGIRTEESENRSPVWPVICKVFCRIKWSIKYGPWDPWESVISGKSAIFVKSGDFREIRRFRGIPGNVPYLAVWLGNGWILAIWLAGLRILGWLAGDPGLAGWEPWEMAGNPEVWLGNGWEP